MRFSAYMWIFSFLLLVFSTQDLMAQRQKKEKTKKQKPKEMVTQLQGQVNGFQTQVQNLNGQVEDLQQTASRLREERNALQAQLQQLQDSMSRMRVVPTVAPENEAGILFKVQLGAYNKFNFAAITDDIRKIKTEQVNGLNKYVIGYFSSLDIAREVVRDFRRLGIRDSWIVPYKDGERISDAEAEKLLGMPIRDKK